MLLLTRVAYWTRKLVQEKRGIRSMQHIIKAIINAKYNIRKMAAGGVQDHPDSQNRANPSATGGQLCTCQCLVRARQRASLVSLI
jgi:hypothetical protein